MMPAAQPGIQPSPAGGTPEPVTHIGANGIKLIETFEGFRASPYQCPAGIWTIGYGSTYYENGKHVQQGDPAISLERAQGLLLALLASFEKTVASLTRTAKVTQNQFDALTSFAYNAGPKALQNSTLLKKVVANHNDPAIRDEFMKWVMGGGRQLPGLVRRRQAEANLYFS